MPGSARQAKRRRARDRRARAAGRERTASSRKRKVLSSGFDQLSRSGFRSGVAFARSTASKANENRCQLRSANPDGFAP